MQTPPRSQKREPQSFLSPVEKTMRSLVAGTFSKDPSELARVFDAVKRGNKARIYSLIDNTCLIRDCFMQFRDDEKIGSLCFTIQDQNKNESTMSVPLHLISDIWLGKQTSALMDPSIPDEITELACTILFIIDDRTTEINFSAESADVLNNWIVAINDIMRRSGRQLCQSDVESTPKTSKKPGNGPTANPFGSSTSMGSTKRRFSIIAEPPTLALRETSTVERTRYMAMRLHIRSTVTPAMREAVATHARLRPSIAASLRNFSTYMEKACSDVISTVRGFTDVSHTLKTALDRERSKSKALLNQLIEAQGNIRVFARVRPLLAFEQQETCVSVYNQVPEPGSISSVISTTNEFDDLASVIAGEEGTVLVNTGERTNGNFTFDKVFGPEAAQSTVAREIVPFVHSCIDGYNVCIMAYGQTGSGKTFTMEGTREMPGVNYRALEELFKRTLELQTTAKESGQGDIEYTVTLSAIEIYNETPRDLLFAGSDPSQNKLEIRGSEKGVVVPGLVTVPVTSVEQVRHILVTKAYRNRAVGCTNMNATSSRSHCAVFITIECENKKNGAKTNGKLVMVDLAGSERIDKSGATGVAKEEANNINLSLTCLGNVISALQTKAKDKTKHIPYRDSKLTYLLQDCLSGNSKCLMFCNLSPASSNMSESICTLRFASRAREVQLGKAKKNNAAPPAPIPSAPSASSVGTGVNHVALQAANSQLTAEARQRERENNTLKSHLQRAEEERAKVEARVEELEMLLAQIRSQSTNGNTSNNTSMNSTTGRPQGFSTRTGPTSSSGSSLRSTMTSSNIANLRSAAGFGSNSNGNGNRSNIGTPQSSRRMGSGVNGLNGTTISENDEEQFVSASESQFSLGSDFQCTEDELMTASRRLSMKRRLEGESSMGTPSHLKSSRSRTPIKSASNTYRNASSNPRGNAPGSSAALGTMSSAQRRNLTPSNMPTFASNSRMSVSNPKAMLAAAGAALSGPNSIGTRRPVVRSAAASGPTNSEASTPTRRVVSRSNK